MFTYLFWKRETEHAHKAQREREREDRIPSSLRANSTEPNVGIELTNREIMNQPEIKSGR